MILNRLYELAVRENLVAEPAFENQPVPFVIAVDDGGRFIAPIENQRGEIVTVKKTKSGETEKRTPDKGKVRSIPRPHGNAANQGFARYFVDTIPRVLPVNDDEKSARSRKTFWQQMDAAADATDDPGLRAVQAFGHRLASDPSFAEDVKKAIEDAKPGPGERVVFAYYPDHGLTIMERPTVRQWFASLFSKCSDTKQQLGPVGFCTVTGTEGPLPTSHAIRLTGIPGTLPTGASIVSFDKAAFRHYDLEGAANAAIGYAAADGYARAFQRLRGDKRHCFSVGGTLFLFWTRLPVDTGIVMALNEPTAEQIKVLLENVYKGKIQDPVNDANDFYLLAVSGNSARVIVRDYLERPLSEARRAIARWFEDLSIADPTKEYRGQPNAAFPLWLLASATARESDRVAPETQIRLMRTALTGGLLPDSILVACLSRLRAEGSDRFRVARMALIKLILKRKEVPVTEALDAAERHPAYVYGRLLAVCGEIQQAALGDVSANIVDRFYGRFSTAPSFVLRRLIDGALDHLKKMRGGEKDGLHNILESRLTDVVKIIPADPLSGQMSLVDQARFSIGFFHQKAKTVEEIAERVRAKAAKANNK